MAFIMQHNYFSQVLSAQANISFPKEGGMGGGPEHHNTPQKIIEHRITKSHKKPQHRK